MNPSPSPNNLPTADDLLVSVLEGLAKLVTDILSRCEVNFDINDLENMSNDKLVEVLDKLPSDALLVPGLVCAGDAIDRSRKLLAPMVCVPVDRVRFEYETVPAPPAPKAKVRIFDGYL